MCFPSLSFCIIYHTHTDARLSSICDGLTKGVGAYNMINCRSQRFLQFTGPVDVGTGGDFGESFRHEWWFFWRFFDEWLRSESGRQPRFLDRVTGRSKKATTSLASASWRALGVAKTTGGRLTVSTSFPSQHCSQPSVLATSCPWLCICCNCRCCCCFLLDLVDDETGSRITSSCLLGPGLVERLPSNS
jgi:hypothetical protein